MSEPVGELQSTPVLLSAIADVSLPGATGKSPGAAVSPSGSSHEDASATLELHTSGDSFSPEENVSERTRNSLSLLSAHGQPNVGRGAMVALANTRSL